MYQLRMAENLIALPPGIDRPREAVAWMTKALSWIAAGGRIPRKWHNCRY